MIGKKVQCEMCGIGNFAQVGNDITEFAWKCVDCGTPHETIMRTRIIGDRRYRDREWLKEMYENYTMSQVADMCDITPMTVFSWLKKHNIETRPRGPRLKD